MQSKMAQNQQWLQKLEYVQMQSKITQKKMLAEILLWLWLIWLCQLVVKKEAMKEHERQAERELLAELLADAQWRAEQAEQADWGEGQEDE